MEVTLTQAAHLGFSEGRGTSFRKGVNQYITKKKRV